MDALLCTHHLLLPATVLSTTSITVSSGIGNNRRLNLLIRIVWVSLVRAEGGFDKVKEVILLLQSMISCATAMSAEFIALMANGAVTVQQFSTCYRLQPYDGIQSDWSLFISSQN